MLPCLLYGERMIEARLVAQDGGVLRVTPQINQASTPVRALKRRAFSWHLQPIASLSYPPFSFWLRGG
jgi:hypothetical protein